MKILILEDNDEKFDDIKKTLVSEFPDCSLTRSPFFANFVQQVSTYQFDLIVADLLVPLRRDGAIAEDVTEEIIATLRDTDCINFATPVIAVTLFAEIAQQNYAKFHRLDLTLVQYSEDSSDWIDALLFKARKCIPKRTYDFIIFCALAKEADAYESLGYEIGSTFKNRGLNCRSIEIGEKSGVIVVPPRMGLVNAAITCSRAIDLFEPSLICMSGICAGVEGKADIYDVVISEMCHQHDSGKWTSEGFIPELWAVHVPHETHVTISQLIRKPDFLEEVRKDIVLKRNEFPKGSDEFNFEIRVAPTSSGSSVIADESALDSIREQHRKMMSFEMESYALYEAARQSGKNLTYFSAKSVVDNGDSLKSDDFHRVACILSAKTVYELINRGVI